MAKDKGGWCEVKWYLSDKRGKVVVLEEIGQDLVAELHHILDHECFAIVVPADDFVAKGALVSWHTMHAHRR